MLKDSLHLDESSAAVWRPDGVKCRKLSGEPPINAEDENEAARDDKGGTQAAGGWGSGIRSGAAQGGGLSGSCLFGGKTARTVGTR